MASSIIETLTRAFHHGTNPIGPLTTVWTPPSSGCTSADYYYDESCLPSGSKLSSVDTESRYFSPAICPLDMISAAPVPTSYAGPPIEPDETAIIDYDFSVYKDSSATPSVQPRCYTTWTTRYWTYYSTCGLFTCRTTRSTRRTSTTSDWGYAIQVRWQSKDLPSLETDPLNPGAKPTWSTTTPSSPTVTVTSEAVPGKVSVGAKAGIGVGVSLSALLLVGFVVMMIRRRRRLERDSGLGADQPVARGDGQPYMMGSAVVQDVQMPMSPAPSYSNHNSMSQPVLAGSPEAHSKGQVYLSGNSVY